MFKRPRVNVIESNQGYSVEILGRTGLLYSEGEKCMHVDSEVLNAESMAVIERSIQTWESPFEAEVIDDRKRASILENIRHALQFDNVTIVIE